MNFRRILIIYNPNSTGNSELMAKQFAKRAQKVFPKAKIELVATKFVAHGEEIAIKAARLHGKTLIVSSSGDGGYHEVINGLMSGKGLLSNVTSAVLPAGNANDHSRTMHDAPLHERLRKARHTKIDLLKITIRQPGKKTVRYAHSYAGLGFTPQVARELNKHQLSTAKEISLVLKTFRQFKPFDIEIDDKAETFDSLIFCNINQMAKVLTLAEDNKPDDGRLEVVAIRHRSKVRMVLAFLQAAIFHLEPQQRVKRYRFKVLHSMPLQIDGEVIDLAKNANVTVAVARHALKTLV